jgi:2-iminobutanoate/2-iminopropanoate deaminase
LPRQRAVKTEGAPAAIGPYSQGIREDGLGLVFCSGQIGLDPASGTLVDGGVTAEMEQIFRNVEAVLRAAGSSLADIVRTTLYLTDLADFAAANEVYAARLREPFPARATVQVVALPKGAKAEMEVTAVVAVA